MRCGFRRPLPPIIIVLMTFGAVAVSQPQAHADQLTSTSSFGLDASVGKNCVRNPCSMSLTTTSSNDVIVVVVQSCDACQISVTDSQGLTYNQRTSYTDGSSGKSLSELYTVAQSPVESDNITVTSSGQYYLTSVEILALRGADTSIIFDPGSPVTATPPLASATMARAPYSQSTHSPSTTATSTRTTP